VPNRRRLGRGNVVCVIELACVGGKRGKRGAVGGSGKGPNVEEVDSEQGASKGRCQQLHT
jgi:hypothetical protein